MSSANGFSNIADDSDVAVVAIQPRGEPYVLTRGATEFLNTPVSSLFKVGDIIDLIIKFFQPMDKISMRAVSRIFHRKLPGPPPDLGIPRIPDLRPYIVNTSGPVPMERKKGEAPVGCCGFLEPVVMCCSNGKEHVVTVGPTSQGQVVCFFICYALMLASLFTPPIIMLVTLGKVHPAIFAMCAGFFIFGLGMGCVADGWQRFVVNYDREEIYGVNVAWTGCFGIHLCRQIKGRLRKFTVDSFKIEKEVKWKNETVYDAEGMSQGEVPVKVESYTTWAAGFRWPGKSNIEPGKQLARKIEHDFYPSDERRKWKMV